LLGKFIKAGQEGDAGDAGKIDLTFLVKREPVIVLLNSISARLK